MINLLITSQNSSGDWYVSNVIQVSPHKYKMGMIAVLTAALPNLDANWILLSKQLFDFNVKEDRIHVFVSVQVPWNYLSDKDKEENGFTKLDSGDPLRQAAVFSQSRS